jgi:hypothetical protein
METGIDDGDYITSNPMLSVEEACNLRFGSRHPQSSDLCRRCFNTYSNHNGCQCREESRVDYLNFLRTGTFEPKKISIKLGADPEFEVRDSSNRWVPANSVISDENRDKKFGLDGCSSTGELRTDPGNPEEVLQSISSILTEGAYQIPSTHGIYSGSGKHNSLGGHIHFSGIGPDRRLLKLMDQLIAQPLREISNHSLRRRSGYGDNSEYRTNDHGWEYRTPCSWISHPIIAQGVLKIAFECAKAFVENQAITFATKDAFVIYMMTKDHASALIIEKFYKVVERLKEKRLLIEEVEIFQAWKKKPVPGTSSGTLITFTWNPEDYNISEIKGLVEGKKLRPRREAITKMVLKVCGAKSERTLEDVIYVPSNIVNFLPKRIARAKVILWKSENIGLSHNLREDIYRSAEVLCFIRWWLFKPSSSKKSNLISLIEEGETCAESQALSVTT